MKKALRTAYVTVFTALVLFMASGCTPHENDSCSNEGGYYTHTENGKTVSLTCTRVGIDRYVWKKS